MKCLPRAVGRRARLSGACAVLSALLCACSGAIGGEEAGDEPGPAPPGAPPPSGVPMPGTPGQTPPPPGEPPRVTPPSCGSTPSVGAAPLRRLTREQYANAVRDLLGTRPTVDTLTADETVGPFFANAVASTTDLVAQQYMETAERVARAAMARLEALVPCARGGTGDEACVASFIEGFGRRAYRRPLTADEKTRYRTLFNAYAGVAGGFAGGVRGVIQTMLQSPHFLYHMEFAEGAAGATGVVPVGPYALASRLSFFLWNSIPDEALLQAAASGALSDPRNIKAQVDRMLRDGKARETIASFHLQWLDVDGIGSVTKDPRVFPAFNSAVRTAMRNETVAFADHVVRQGDGKLETLLTAPFSIVTAELAPIYGLDPAAIVPMRPTPLDPSQRAGLLTHASVLAAHAHANQSSPVSRGVIVRKNLLCQPLPDPPPDVNNTPPDPKPNLTTRERFSIHQQNPACSGCHLLIDELGFGFENYDGIGVYRRTESGKPVDARGKIVATQDIDGDFVGAVELAQRLARSRQVRECVTKQWFRYALGRMESEADACTVHRLLEAFEGARQDVRALLAALAGSDAFRYRRAGQ